MFAGLFPNPKPMGAVMVNNGGAWGFVVLNFKPFSNRMLWAVVAKNEPPKSKWAFCPKIMPLGFIRKRLALPKTPRVPKILEALLPVTLVKIFCIPVGLVKYAACPAPILNCVKLWKRLTPRVAPPLIWSLEMPLII